MQTIEWQISLFKNRIKCFQNVHKFIGFIHQLLQSKFNITFNITVNLYNSLQIQITILKKDTRNLPKSLKCRLLFTPVECIFYFYCYLETVNIFSHLRIILNTTPKFKTSSWERSVYEWLMVSKRHLKLWRCWQFCAVLDWFSWINYVK